MKKPWKIISILVHVYVPTRGILTYPQRNSKTEIRSEEIEIKSLTIIFYSESI